MNCRRKDLDCFARKNLSYLHHNYRLCSDHFEQSQFMNPASKAKLIWNAVPTIFHVPNPPQRFQSRLSQKGDMIIITTVLLQIAVLKS